MVTPSLTMGLCKASGIQLNRLRVKNAKQIISKSVRRCTSDSSISKSRNIFYFDTHNFVQHLQTKGFTQDQSEVVCEALMEIIHTHIDHQAKNMVTKSQQEIMQQQIMSSIASVKKDMLILEKSEFSALRHETEKQSSEILRIDNMIKDEIIKLGAQMTLDINLERSRAKEAHAENETQVSQLNGHIDMQIANLRTTFEQYRYDVLKFAGGTVLSCLTICLGFYRLWSS